MDHEFKDSDSRIALQEPVAVFQLQAGNFNTQFPVFSNSSMDWHGPGLWKARPVVFSGNVVAGCPDIGVLMRPETCDDVEKDPGASDVLLNSMMPCLKGLNWKARIEKIAKPAEADDFEFKDHKRWH